MDSFKIQHTFTIYEQSQFKVLKIKGKGSPLVHLFLTYLLVATLPCHVRAEKTLTLDGRQAQQDGHKDIRRSMGTPWEPMAN